MGATKEDPRKEEFNGVEWTVGHTPHVSLSFSLRDYLLWLISNFFFILWQLGTMKSSLVTHVQQVLIPVANGSEAAEIVTIADILRRAKVDVVIASVEKSVKVLASQGTKIVADKLIGKAAESIYDLIILPVSQIK